MTSLEFLEHKHNQLAGGRFVLLGANDILVTSTTTFTQRKHMITPDYIKILKLDKIAMKSKTRPDFLNAVKPRLQYAKNIGVEGSFLFFVERAWDIFGDGK